MRKPTEFELQHLAVYDPAKAHAYYEKHKKLTGRKRGHADVSGSDRSRINGHDPRTGKTKEQIGHDARSRQRKELGERINRLEGKLRQLDAKIREMESEAASKDRKGEAKKERARKEAEKPKTAAEKAKAAREAKQFRDKHKQELKSKQDSKDNSSKKKSGGKANLADFKALATKVRGQIAVAKQKLAAL